MTYSEADQCNNLLASRDHFRHADKMLVPHSHVHWKTGTPIVMSVVNINSKTICSQIKLTEPRHPLDVSSTVERMNSITQKCIRYHIWYAWRVGLLRPVSAVLKKKQCLSTYVQIVHAVL